LENSNDGRPGREMIIDLFLTQWKTDVKNML